MPNPADDFAFLFEHLLQLSNIVQLLHRTHIRTPDMRMPQYVFHTQVEPTSNCLVLQMSSLPAKTQHPEYHAAALLRHDRKGLGFLLG